MSFETSMRLIFAIIALGLAGFLVARLVTGRGRAGRRVVERHSEPGAYWGSVGNNAILAAGLAIGAIQPSDDSRLPILFLGLLGGQLFEMLVSGAVQMPAAVFSRAEQPKKYWRWVAFHALIVALILAFLIVQRVRPTIL
jgi:hypothetical protein